MKPTAITAKDQRARADVVAFYTAAELVEAFIESEGLVRCKDTPWRGLQPTWRAWEAFKTASHFNLGISLELALKNLFRLNGKEPPHCHRYSKLYDTLEETWPGMATRMEQCCKRAAPTIKLVRVHPEQPSQPPPVPDPSPDINTLRDLLVYLEEEMRMSTKRYASAYVGDDGPPRHYLEDIGGVVALIREFLSLGLPPS